MKTLLITASPYSLNFFCLYVITWWNTIANFSVMRTIPKENIYVSTHANVKSDELWNWKLFSLNSLVEEKYFFVGHYIHLQWEGIWFIVIYFLHAIWRRKSGNIVQWKLVHYRI
jgi:hypothetical protein